MVVTSPVTRYSTELTSGLTSGGAETTLSVASVTLPSTETIDFDKIGDRLYLCINPGASNEEFVYVTGLGSLTYTGMVRGLSYQGTPTGSAGRAKAHSAGEPVVATDYGGWWAEQYAAIDDAEAILGLWTFSPSAIPSYSSAPTFTPGSNQLASILYADNLAIAGAPDSSLTTKGIVEIATDSELASGAAAGGTSAPIVARASSFNQTGAAGKVPVATSRGVIDETFIDLGTNYTAANAINALAMIYPDSATTVKQATAGAPSSKVNATDPAGTGPGLTMMSLREDTDRSLLIHGIPGSAGTFYLRVATFNAAETDFAYGTQVQLTADQVERYSICRLTTNTYMVCYTTNANDLFAVVVTLSGATVTVNTRITVNASMSDGHDISVATISATSAVVSYSDSGNEIQLAVLTVSGTTVTDNGDNAATSATTSKSSAIVLLTSTTLLVAYDESGVTKAKVGTISGTTITFGSAVTFKASGLDGAFIGGCRLTDTKGVLLYEIADPNGELICFTVSGSTPTFGSAVSLANYEVYKQGEGRLARISDTIFGVVVCASASTGVRTYEADGTVLAQVGSSLTIDIDDTNGGDASLSLLRPFKMMTYGNNGGDDEIRIITFSTTNIENRIGATAAAVADAALAYVEYIHSPMVSSGLTVGTNYYIGWDGLVTTETSVQQIKYGVAITATKIMLR